MSPDPLTLAIGERLGTGSIEAPCFLDLRRREFHESKA
jgi:hypothetical protein